MSFFDDAPEDVRKDAALAKSQLCLTDFSADMDMLFEDLERPLFSNPEWPSPYGVADNLVTEAYLEAEAFDPLARLYSQHRWPLGQYVHDFLDLLEEKGRSDLIANILTGVFDETARFFRSEKTALKKHRSLPDAQRLFSEAKVNALGCADALAEYYQSNGVEKELADLAVLRKEIAQADL